MLSSGVNGVASPVREEDVGHAGEYDVFPLMKIAGPM